MPMDLLVDHDFQARYRCVNQFAHRISIGFA